MDKDVEVSRDQNTIVVDGIRYTARKLTGTGTCCGNCSVPYYSSHDFCSVIPCDASERTDGTNVYLSDK